MTEDIITVSEMGRQNDGTNTFIVVQNGTDKSMELVFLPREKTLPSTGALSQAS